MNDHIFARAGDAPTAQRAEGCTIYTVDGRRVLDGAAGAVANSIGHGHPAVVAAMAEQASTVDYVHATQFTTEVLARYATAVAEIAPVDDLRLFPVSGGSEANETAFKLARAHHLARGEDRHLIVARSGAYHGNTRGVLDASDRAGLLRGYEPWVGHTVRAPMANRYRDDRSGEELAAETERSMIDAGIERVAAFIAEPISGATMAAALPPDDYWPAVAEVCRRHGVLLIVDEVMTGFGRTGRWFGSDHWGLRPDIITAGKGASSGYWPLGLMMCSGAIHAAAADTFVHGFTWSHHPIGAAVADAVLGVLRQDDLPAGAERHGRRARKVLRTELADHPNVGDVRGLGLMVGVEFVTNQRTKQPFDRSDQVAERIVAACFERDLTVYPCTSAVDGAIGDAVMLGPPLSVTDDELDAMLERLVDAVQAVLPSAPSGMSSQP